MEEKEKKKKYISIIGIILLLITVIWAIIVFYNYRLVKNDKRPILCFNYKRAVEDDDEYYIECKGILFKYKEYYYIESDFMNAREYTLFFKDYTRENDVK